MSTVSQRIVLAVTSRPRVRRLFTGTRYGRALALRFVAGETLDDAVTVARRINHQGGLVSLDHLGEHVTERREAEAAREDYLAVLDRIAGAGIDGNISVKLTQLGLGLDDDLAARSLRRLAERAGEAGTTVTIDMEESMHTAATLRLYHTEQQRTGNLGVAIQAYLHRTAADLQDIIPLGGHIRLCKGAYREPPEIAFSHRSDVDASFDRLAAVLMASPRVRPAVATHDSARIDEVIRLAGLRPHGSFEFQMLYGVRTRLQRRLIAAGYPLRVYVPYGAAWYPYLTRRLAERPANVLFFLRALVGR